MNAAEQAKERARNGGPPPGKPKNSAGASTASGPPKEWPEPRPLPGRTMTPVPVFDLELLPRELRWYVHDVAERMQVAIDIPAIAAMCALAIVASNARTIHPKRYDNWRVYCVLWGAVIAPAGSMKSPAIASIEKMLTKIEIAERERFEKQQFRRAAADMLGKASKDALKKRIADAARGKEGADPIDVDALAEQLREQACADETDSKQRRLRATDATIEKLGELVSNGKRRCRPMIVWCDELGGLLHSFDREGHESARDFYLAAWSVQTHRVDRIGRGELFLRDLAISIFGAMTPGPFEKYVREAAGGESADGFLQRLQFLVYPDQGTEWRHVDRSPDHAAEARALKLLERLFAIDEDDDHGKPKALNFTEQAQELFDRWYGDLERRLRDPKNGLSEARRSHLSKYRSLMPAIALLCHLASGPGTEDQDVSLDAAERAVKWCAYLDAHAERVYSLAHDNAWLDAELVRRIETGKLRGSLNVRLIQRGLPGTLRAEDVHAACEVLEEHGWLVLEEVKQPRGRPFTIAHINPRGDRSKSTASAATASAAPS